MSAPRYVITKGGEPTPEELAAVTVALTPVAVATTSGPQVPAWTRAALHEGVGGAPLTSAADVLALPTDRPRADA